MHGRTFEPEIGLYFYRARYLHPGLGRFLQIDLMGYQDSMNLYQAFNQNPVNFVDPFGEESLKELYKAYLEGGVNTLVSIGLAGYKKIAMLLFPSKAKQIAGFNVNVNITDDKYSTLQAYIDKDMTVGKMLIEDLKTATIVYPAGKQLGEFTGNVYVGWFSDYSQEVKDSFQMESARGVVPTGVAVGSLFFGTKVITSKARNYKSVSTFDLIEELGYKKNKVLSEEVTLYHGTSSSRSSKIVGNSLKPKRGFRGDTFFAEDFVTAEWFANESVVKYGYGQTLPKSFSVIEFRIPAKLAADLGLLKRSIIGQATELRFVDIAGSSGFERILTSKNLARFNNALRKGEILVRRKKL
jgi:RHS repeat-associated protein